MEVEFPVNSISVGVGRSKCLLLGGYIVLDHRYSGICIDLDPQVKCTTKILEMTQKTMITVKSEQVNLSKTIFEDDWQKTENFKGKFERFILASLYVFFNYFHLTKPVSMSMVIDADPHFYTTNGKTGLGSSSATTVSILMSLLKFTKNLPAHNKENIIEYELTEEDKTLLFKLASVAHSIAQNKVGSCFDISTAIWGAQVYKRPTNDVSKIESIKNDWDNQHNPLHFPKNTKLWLIATGFPGSSTEGLVTLFNTNKGKDQSIFNDLINAINIAEKTIQENDIKSIPEAFKYVKNIQRVITKQWKVEILPDPVDKLINEVEQIPGVITAIPPGAGGYDAIAVLTHNTDIDFGSHPVVATKTF